MKKIIQLVLLLILIFLMFNFYNRYFKEEEKIGIQQKTSQPIIPKEDNNQADNNVIQNLEYEINIKKDNNYKLSSKTSEIFYKNGVELIKMLDVRAIFTDKNNSQVIVTSDEAVYNNENYNTIFEKNIKIKYLNNIIYGDALNLDLEKNSLIIYGNVSYDGINGNLIADNIKLDLITKQINIFMNDTDKKVMINSKK